MFAPTLTFRHTEPLADGHERPVGAGIEVKQRIPAERLDQSYRKLDRAVAASRDADMLGADAESCAGHGTFPPPLAGEG